MTPVPRVAASESAARRPPAAASLVSTLCAGLALLLAACGPGPETGAEGDDSGAAGSAEAAARADAEVSDGTDDVRVASALLAAPEALREGATVLAAGPDGSTVIREGEGPLVCLADDPDDDRFQVSCYHESLEPFMARGRELRRQGVTGAAVDSARFAEIEAGELPMPEHPAALYTLAAPRPPEDPAAGPPEEGQRLFVLYVSGARAEEVGLPPEPAEGWPWLMLEGTHKAHVMFTP